MGMVTPMSTLFSAKCPSCGGEFKLAAFRVDGKRRSICRTCYRKAQRRARAERAKTENLKREVKYESAIARKKVVDTSLLSAMLRQVAKESAGPRQRVRRYSEKVNSGRWHTRTLQALERQSARVQYFEELKRWIVQEAQAGQLKPYLYYRSNTWLLHIHNCKATYEPADKACYLGEKT